MWRSSRSISRWMVTLHRLLDALAAAPAAAIVGAGRCACSAAIPAWRRRTRPPWDAGRLPMRVVEVFERAARPERVLELVGRARRARRRRINFSKMIAQHPERGASSRQHHDLDDDVGLQEQAPERQVDGRRGRRPGSATCKCASIHDLPILRSDMVHCRPSRPGVAMRRAPSRQRGGMRRRPARRADAGEPHGRAAPASRRRRARRPAAQQRRAAPPPARGLHLQRVVEPRRRADSRLAAPHHEDKPCRRRQLALRSTPSRAAARCAPARRSAGSWRGRRCRRHRCPRSRRARHSGGRAARRIGRSSPASQHGRAARLALPRRRRQAEMAPAALGSACGRAACAGGSPAGSGRARSRPRACRAARPARRPASRRRPARRRSARRCSRR